MNERIASPSLVVCPSLCEAYKRKELDEVNKRRGRDEKRSRRERETWEVEKTILKKEKEHKEGNG